SRSARQASRRSTRDARNSSMACFRSARPGPGGMTSSVLGLSLALTDVAPDANMPTARIAQSAIRRARIGSTSRVVAVPNGDSGRPCAWSGGTWVPPPFSLGGGACSLATSARSACRGVEPLLELREFVLELLRELDRLPRWHGVGRSDRA